MTNAALKTPGAAETGLIETDATDIHAWLDAGEIILVDVRETAEYEQEHIPGAVLCPLSMFEADLFPRVKDMRLVLHCAVGKRSAAAGKQLLGAGHETVHNLKGGIQAWKAAGCPTEIQTGPAGTSKDLPFLTLVEGAPAPAPAPSDRPGVHPGKVLENEFILPLGLAPAALARETGLSPQKIAALIAGRASVSADVALRLAHHLCTTEDFWMRLQAAHDLAVAREKLGAEIKRAVKPRRGGPC